MKLITSLTIFCIVILLLMQSTRQPLPVRNRISGSHYRYSSTLIFLFGFALTFVAAFREGFVDTSVYESLYEQVGTNWDNAFNDTIPIDDYGFSLFMVFLNQIDTDPRLMIVVTSVLTIVPFVYIIAKYSQDVPLSLFVFFSMSYMTTMNGIRQIMAAALLSLALPWLRDRKFIPFAILSLVLSTFHASLIVMIPLYFVIVGKRMNKGIWIFLAAVAFCFAAPSAANAVMGSILEDTVYADYLDNEAQMGVMRFLVALVPTVLTLLYCWIKRGNHEGENKHAEKYMSQRVIDVLINMQIVNFGFTALGMRMVYFARIGMYFTCVLPLLLPVIIRGTFKGRSAWLVKRITIAMFMFYHAYQIYSYDNYGYLYGFVLDF